MISNDYKYERLINKLGEGMLRNEKNHPYYVNDDFLNNGIKDYKRLCSYYNMYTSDVHRWNCSPSCYDHPSIRKKYGLSEFFRGYDLTNAVYESFYIYFNNMTDEDLTLFCKKVVDFSPENKERHNKNSFEYDYEKIAAVDYTNYENEDVELKEFIKDILNEINYLLENTKTEQRIKK